MSYIKLDPKSAWYKNCKRRRKEKANICSDCPFFSQILQQESRNRHKERIAAIPEDERCEVCNGQGWAWDFELKHRINRDPTYCGIDDTKYTCDWCNGTGKKLPLVEE
jgi:Zn-finger domain-containing protein